MPALLARLASMENWLGRIDEEFQEMRRSSAKRQASVAALIDQMDKMEELMTKQIEKAAERDAAIHASLRQLNLTALAIAGGIIAVLLAGLITIIAGGSS